MVMEVLHEEMGEGGFQCMNHLYRNSTPGGVCAFCLQEKLGKLVSSSFSVGVFPPSTASSSASFRSDFGGTAAALQSRHLVSSSTKSGIGKYDDIAIGYYDKKPRLPFILTHRRKKKKDEAVTNSDAKNIVFKRSKSTSTLRHSGFWSFRFLSKQSTSKKAGKSIKDDNFPSTTHSTVITSTLNVIASSSVNNGVAAVRTRNREDLVEDENGRSPDEVSFERKVSRSRSVGCGSRSFSGDLFERISTGFGDCTLRRVESQREGKAKVASGGQDYIKERVKCGGIFSGLIIPSSSSSSSSNEDNNLHGKSITAAHSSVRNPSHVRSRSWGWAFASPMRAFGKPSSTGKRFAVSSKNATPNLAETTPSLLAVSG
ncbi:hypothetical protein F511_10835 [Dorcoceras hygrometricum]|uniref:Uncharacterized protein n=1 Tax=Dorcoceras hygrometricum TaxID=472368 RepID=A0A2Z7CI28_9LAMI|nr:hypothetical protein F511_10835 [Dorcoceras hygrometricum]